MSLHLLRTHLLKPQPWLNPVLCLLCTYTHEVAKENLLTGFTQNYDLNLNWVLRAALQCYPIFPLAKCSLSHLNASLHHLADLLKMQVLTALLLWENGRTLRFCTPNRLLLTSGPYFKWQDPRVPFHTHCSSPKLSTPDALNSLSPYFLFY